MSDHDNVERRLAHNEVLYRTVNEAIARGLWPGEGHELIPFRCECALVDCNAMIEMTADDYEAIRENSRWFFLRPNHELGDIEDVVERRGGYVLVEKRGVGGAVAEESDARGD